MSEEETLSFAELSPSDFDGHTEFENLTSEQRLQWLSSIAKFLWMVRVQKTKDGG